MSIRTKIVALILLVVVLTAAIGILVGRNVASSSLKDEARGNLEAIARARSLAITNMLDYQRQNIELLTNQANTYFGMLDAGTFPGGLGPDDYAAISLIMGSVTSANENIWQALYLNEQGVVMASAYTGTRSLSASDQPHGEDWSAVDWSLIDLDGVDWSRVDAATIDWAYVDVTKVDWAQIDVGRVNWGYMISLETIDWAQIPWEDIDLGDVSWSDIDWGKLDFGKIDWSRIDLTRINWSQIDIGKLDLAKVDLSKLPFDEINLGHLNWDNADLSHTEAFKRGKEGTYIGAYPLYEGATRFVLAVAAPFSVKGKMAGAMAYLGGEDELYRVVADRSGLGDTGEAYIVDERGYLLTPSLFVEDAVLKQQVDFTGVQLQVDSDEEVNSVDRTNYMGTKVFGVYQPLGDTDWTLVVEQSRSEVLNPVTDLTRNMTWAFVGMLVVWILLAGLLARAITRPIIRLREGAERIMNGDWDYDVSTTATDEVGTLSRAFGAMTADLKRSQEELQVYSSRLEEKVVERTEELSRANQELKQAREGLEERVWERTRELAEVNRGLQDQIRERKRAEQQVRNSLAEKEVLLKEIHHRVKNNLQIISSLLNLQKDGVPDSKSQEMFDESGKRVRSMALIHEQLYKSDDLAQIDFVKYVYDLSHNLMHSYGNGARNIGLNVEGSNVFMEIDMAVPCGLMVNEIVTNAIKYAFPDSWQASAGQDVQPQIDIVLREYEDHRLLIKISDNGIGLPQGIDCQKTDTLGMQLISSLANQIEAEIEIDRSDGTTFSIIISESEWRRED